MRFPNHYHALAGPLPPSSRNGTPECEARRGTHGVSAVVPAYNAERYLCQCQDSLRSELGSALQVIAAGNGSSDASGAP